MNSGMTINVVPFVRENGLTNMSSLTTSSSFYFYFRSFDFVVAYIIKIKKMLDQISQHLFGFTCLCRTFLLFCRTFTFFAFLGRFAFLLGRERFTFRSFLFRPLHPNAFLSRIAWFKKILSKTHVIVHI